MNGYEHVEIEQLKAEVKRLRKVEATARDLMFIEANHGNRKADIQLATDKLMAALGGGP